MSVPVKYKAYTRHNIHTLPQYQHLGPALKQAVEVVSAVFPFRTNRYIVDELIDWSRVPDDPIYQLTFPQQGMLAAEDFEHVAALLESDLSARERQAALNAIRMRHNPHPAGQMQYNVPEIDGEPVKGIQHKYHETVLFFPAQGQTCHAYCSYCFRWAQFVGIEDLKFASREVEELIGYLRLHPEVTDVLFTGGDPAIMRTKILARYIEPLLEARLPGLQTIRIGTKALAYWPGRFVTDDDADDLLRLFEKVNRRGLHLAVMAHFSHPRELATPLVHEAIRRLHTAGVEIRMQAPLIRHVNNDPQAWVQMWREGVRLGMFPYYLFVSRNTGPKNYFDVPLGEAYRLFRAAYAQLSGLGRTVRGPVMSTTPGKVLINGVIDLQGARHFVLSFLQARDPRWVGRPFLAEYDPAASWLTDLRPAHNQKRFFFEQDFHAPAHEDRAATEAAR